MPADVQAQFYLTRDIPGGPTFVYARFGGIAVNYKQISLNTAAFLVDSGCQDIARVEAPKPPRVAATTRPAKPQKAEPEADAPTQIDPDTTE